MCKNMMVALSSRYRLENRMGSLLGAPGSMVANQSTAMATQARMVVPTEQQHLEELS
eukprot:m.148841 g.148841  ORF g.148841 m.148841 type:complete len:57 (-) comp17328_c0_seq2:89-259(-)